MGALTQAGWQRVEELLHGALDLPPRRRASFLERACGGDAALRLEVEGLIACADTDPGRFEKPVALRAIGEARPVEELKPGDRLGAWRVEKLLGRGGMGEVYLAARADGQYEQKVAVKLMRPEAVGQLERFHAERQILAKLEHPGIARLLDSGVAPGERPYMLMEYVAGQPIGAFCQGRRLSLRARLELFLQVCEAVSYAHAHLVIHRDLKPGNILVTADGCAKLLDFGIAKVLNADFAGDATVTRAAPLTPGHAAPEQLAGQPVSTATDVYALGTVLYELLAGRGPWELRQLPVSVAIHKLLHEDAPPASRVAAEQSGGLIEARALQGDLDAILAKALRKDPDARYATVNALRNDLQRYLDGEPVSAGPDSTWYRANKFARRHYVAVGLACVAAVVVAGFVWRLAVERNRALQAVATSQAVSAFLSQDMFAQIGSEQRPLRDLTVKEVLDAGAQQVDKRFAGKPDAAAEVHGALGASYVAMDDASAAERHLERALALYEQQGFSDLPKVLQAVQQLAYVKDALGTLAAEIPRYEHLRELGRARLGRTHSSVLGLGQQLAYARYSFGYWSQAASDLRRLLDDAKAAQPVDEKFLGTTEGLLGRVLIQLGSFDEAERVLRSSLERLIRDVGPQHVQVAQSRTFLAEALAERGDYSAAESEISVALDVATRWAPNEAAAYLIRVRIAQGRLLMEQGRLDDAAKILQGALKVLLAQSGPEGDQTGPVRRPLAETYQRQQRLADAAREMRLALLSSEKAQPRHPGTERIRIGLADIYREQGRPDEARAQLYSVRMEVLDALPAQHPIRAQWLRVRGLLLSGESRAGEARPLLSESLEICRKVYGEGHWRTQRAARELAALSSDGP